jgi:hypothetical protein
VQAKNATQSDGPEPPTSNRTVYGTVRHTDATPLKGIAVKAFQLRVGGEAELGEMPALTLTDVDGQFSIAYALPEGMRRADLFVRAYDDESTMIAISPVRLGARELEQIDLTVSDDRFRGPSEFARTGQALEPLFVGVAPGTPLDGDDIALMVRNTGLRRVHVTAWVTSKRLAERSGLAHEALYGLVRTESTAALPRLLARPRARLRQALLNAADANIISRAAGDVADRMVETLRQAAAALSANPETPGSLGRLLATGKTSPEQHRAFLERYTRHEGPIRDFWRQLRADPVFGDEAVDDMQLSLQLGSLTANHAPLVKALRDRGVAHSAETARFAPQEWLDLLGTEIDGQPIGTPPNVIGDTEAERFENYTRLLTETAALAFPTARVAEALRKASGWRASRAIEFLDANPAFNIKTANLKAALAAGATPETEQERAALEAELSAVQRVARIAPLGREEAVTYGLLTRGYTSALAVSRKSLSSFITHTSDLLGGDDVARTVYQRARFQASRALNAYGLMHPIVAGPTFAALGTLAAVAPPEAEARAASATGQPTWASLFGSVDYCKCEHCRSVYSPAAYFVDLLAWLDGHELDGKTAFEVLNTRRPDLQLIELTCENTNTVMPYTDLVSEILESRVLGGAVPVATTATTDELLANPEFLYPAAYDNHLSQKVYPAALPYDLWGDLGQAYLAHLGVNRADLMRALQRDGTPTIDAVSAAQLGLSTPQWEIIVDEDESSVWEHWGYDGSLPGGTPFKERLAKVSIFLERGGIEYENLLDLLHSRFANPNGIAITGDECDTAAMTLDPLKDQTNADLGRMHRFLRLWRNRGIPMLDLDKLLFGLDVSTLGPVGLRRLADLDRLHALTRAPLLDIVSWWSPMDTFEDRAEKSEPVKSLYDRVYLNRAVDPAAADGSFPLALNRARDQLDNPRVPWDDVRSHLQASLGLTDEELSLLVNKELVEGVANGYRVVTGATATLEGLSALYRHVSLARALKLRVEELLGLLKLTPINPFSLLDTPKTIEFVEAVAAIRASGFSLDQLHYLIEHDPVAETLVGITDEAIGQTLVEIRDGLKRIAGEFSATADPTGEITSAYLAMLLDPDSVAELMTALQIKGSDTDDGTLEDTLMDELGSLFSFDAAHVAALPIAQRFARLRALLAAYLVETQSDALIIERIAAFAGRDLESVEDLLSTRLTKGDDEVGVLTWLRARPYVATVEDEIAVDADPEAFATIRLIYKVASVLNKLEVDIDEQVWLFDIGVRSGLLNPATLPTAPRASDDRTWTAWTRLVDLFALRAALPGGELSLVELLGLLESTVTPPDPELPNLPLPSAAVIGPLEPTRPPTPEETFRSELCNRTGWLRADLDTLVDAFGFQFPDDWRDGQALWRLVDAFALLGRIGASATQADGWATADLREIQAEEIRLATKARYGETQWPAIARGLRDPVRDRQREALVAYLIANDEEKEYADAEDLFEDMLIDVKMSSCMLTSRIKQAISSVQLFIQRAFLSLEVEVSLTRDDRTQWEWMKNYRVWEAARKVFLYPENWIEPELRLNKSPLFEQLENTLLQGEITDAAVEKAYTEYLEDLLRVARLRVMGMYHQYEVDIEGTVDILHVVARTRSSPYEYYYRQWVNASEWTPWELLDVEIEADHLILAVAERRLYMFWPMVVQKSVGVQPSDPDTIPPNPQDFYEMKLASIERLHGRWGARKLSEEYLKVDGKWSIQENSVYFRLAPGTDLTIECRKRYDEEPKPEEPQDPPDYYLPGLVTMLSGTPDEYADLLGTFVVNPCTGKVDVNVDVDPETSTGLALVKPNETDVFRMRFNQPTTFRLAVGALDADQTLTGVAEQADVLNRAQAYSYAYPPQYGEFASQHGVFLDADIRTFHVMPEMGSFWWQMSDTDEIAPEDVESTYNHSYGPIDAPKPPTVIIDPPIPIERQDLLWDAEFMTQDEVASIPRPLRAGPDSTRRVQAAQPLADPSPMPAANEPYFERLKDADLRLSQAQLFEAEEDGDPVTARATGNYRFALFYHPYVCDFMKELRRGGVAGLLDPSPDGEAASLVRQQKHYYDFFVNYEPTSHVLEPYPIQDIDFLIGGAYELYNWEIFFHIPFLIACRLSNNQRFEEARRWFHFIFDPTSRTPETDALRFWKIKPLYQEAGDPIAEFLELATSSEASPEVTEARKQYDQQVQAWLGDPFNPHGIARLRTTAYQKVVVMKYLDNLIAWGDQLFRRDTIESINEATQLYVLALELLGERPDMLPPRSVPVATTFEAVRATLAGTADAPAEQTGATPEAARAMIAGPMHNSFFEQMENFHFDIALHTTPVSTTSTTLWPLDFYFGVPHNDKLVGYWDTVADRLFKIRHCMNIEGVVRQLPLFEPPIDPGMLVRARAQGVDLSSALADLSAPLPHYRFAVMLQKAYSLNQTVRGLGGALLSALEKQDGEELAVLRANQEEALLEAVRQVKKLAIDEARHSLVAAERSLEVVQQRRDYYLRLTIAGLRPEELMQAVLMEKARKKQKSSAIAMAIGGGVAAIPEIITGVSGYAGSPVAKSKIVSGLAIAKAFELGGQVLAINAASLNAEASISGVMGGFIRRAEEWQNQLELARREHKQIEKQIEAAKVRLALAERDRENNERQIEHARTSRAFMENKFTNQELYQWMVGQLASLYFQSYQLAYDTAKQAERAYRHELGIADATFIQFGYWDSLKKGLLAGERLQLTLEGMDAAYIEHSRREYELTKHISLAALDPVALIHLRQTGQCFFSLPEAAFDLDCPGHYMRRIKSVSVTLPCVTGPYTNVNCTLTLTKSSIRTSPDTAAGYARTGDEDTRFTDSFGAIESIVTSGSQNDSGLFETNLRDERYLPFEGAGVISDWGLDLPTKFRQFDYNTISDIILHVRYTAQGGGADFRTKAEEELASALNSVVLSDAALKGQVRLFSLRHNFPNEWHQLLYPGEASAMQAVTLPLVAERFPFAFQGRVALSAIEVFVKADNTVDLNKLQVALASGGKTDTYAPLADLTTWNGLRTAVKLVTDPLGDWTLAIWLGQAASDTGQQVSPEAIEEIMLVCNYTISS